MSDLPVPPRRRHRRSPGWWPNPRRRRGRRGCWPARLGMALAAALAVLSVALVVARAVAA